MSYCRISMGQATQFLPADVAGVARVPHSPPKQSGSLQQHPESRVRFASARFGGDGWLELMNLDKSSCVRRSLDGRKSWSGAPVSGCCRRVDVFCPWQTAARTPGCHADANQRQYLIRTGCFTFAGQLAALRRRLAAPTPPAETPRRFPNQVPLQNLPAPDGRRNSCIDRFLLEMKVKHQVLLVVAQGFRFHLCFFGVFFFLEDVP